jgi:hypothetical protein
MPSPGLALARRFTGGYGWIVKPTSAAAIGSFSSPVREAVIKGTLGDLRALCQKLARRVRSDNYRPQRKDMNVHALEYKIAPDVIVEPVRVCRDSPLEGTGFELPVPREIRFRFRGERARDRWRKRSLILRTGYKATCG